MRRAVRESIWCDRRISLDCETKEGVAGVFGVAALFLALMDALGSGSLLICAAGGYVREGSFRMDVNADHMGLIAAA